MAFCQVVMSKNLVEWVKSDMKITGTPGQRDYKVTYVKGGAGNQHSDEWDEKVCNHMNKHQLDPLPIPFTEPGKHSGQYALLLLFSLILQSRKLPPCSARTTLGILRLVFCAPQLFAAHQSTLTQIHRDAFR